MNRKEFYNAFRALITVETGLTTVVAIKGIQYSIAGLLAPACLQIWMAIFGIYSISGLINCIKELQSR